MHPTLISDRAPRYDSMDGAPPDTSPSPPVDPQDRPRLLIVDDEEGPRESLRMVFKDEYRVRIAASAKDALAILETEKVDVAILDIRMPEITGLDLLEKVRILDPSIEVVMLTAYETPDYLRKALQLRACDYLNKPFDVPNIRSVVANAVTRRSAQQQAQSNIAQLTEIREQLQQLRVKEETMRTRWEIYASIIHDINSPLTIISGLVQLVNQRINQDQPLQTEDVEVMKDRMKRVTRQVTNCIEISRRYLKLLGPNNHEPGKVWINNILLDLGDLVRALPDARGHELQISPLTPDVMLNVNGTDLIQILLNITINALQSTRECHLVEVRSEFHTTPIDFSEISDAPNQRVINISAVQNVSPMLGLSVIDNGPGMGSEILERIFEPFVSQSSTERRAGLGLCIVKRLLKENRCGLHVHSEPGRGSMFTLFLPARAPVPKNQGPVRGG